MFRGPRRTFVTSDVERIRQRREAGLAARAARANARNGG
jgi:hypothetical protein